MKIKVGHSFSQNAASQDTGRKPIQVSDLDGTRIEILHDGWTVTVHVTDEGLVADVALWEAAETLVLVPATDAPEPDGDGGPSMDMTKAELVAFAEAEGIDLTGAKTKADILAAIAGAA